MLVKIQLNQQTGFTKMRDGTATRQKLESVALDLFVKKGVLATTIKDIAKAADVAEGTLYRHYPSKEELATELYIRAYQKLFEALRDAIQDKNTLKEQVSVTCELVCRSYDNDPITFNYLLIAQHHQLPKIKETPYGLNGFLCKLFEQAMQRNELERDDPNFYAAVVMGIVIQSGSARFYERINRPLLEDAPKLIEMINRVLGVS